MADNSISPESTEAKRKHDDTNGQDKRPSAYALRCIRMSPEDLAAFLLAKREAEKKRVANLAPEKKDARDAYFQEYYRTNKDKKDRGIARDRERQWIDRMSPERLKEFRDNKNSRERERRRNIPQEVKVAKRKESHEREIQKILSDPVLHETHRAASRVRSQKRRDTQTDEQRLHTNALNRGRKARQAGAEGRYTAEDVEKIIKSQRGKCAICGKSVGKKIHIDHIIPISKGGSNWPKNLQVTHPKCNVAKGATDPIAFMRRLGKLL